MVKGPQLSALRLSAPAANARVHPALNEYSEYSTINGTSEN